MEQEPTAQSQMKIGETSAVFFGNYRLGDVVYLRLRPERLAGLVTTVTFCAGGCTLYGVAWGSGEEGGHYECELGREWAPDFS